MNVDTMTKKGRKVAKNLEKRGGKLVGEAAVAGERFAEKAADRSERALKAATKAAERSLADLIEAASDVYDERKDDAEEMLRDAGKTIGDSVGTAATSLLAMLPSERRRRRRKKIWLGVAMLLAAAVGYRAWTTRQRTENVPDSGEESVGGNVADIARSTAGS